MSAAATIITQDEASGSVRLKKPNRDRLQLVPTESVADMEPDTPATADGDQIVFIGKNTTVVPCDEDTSHVFDPHDELDQFFAEPHEISPEIAELFGEDMGTEFVAGYLPLGFQLTNMHGSSKRPRTHCHCAERERLQKAAMVDTDLTDPEQVYALCEPLYMPLQ